MSGARWAAGLLLAAVVGAAVFGAARLASPPEAREVRATLSAVELLAGADTAGYARATEPRPFREPEDHGPHPEYRTEWWYLTGNLAAADGRAFGFQLTFFRNALAPEPPGRGSAWNTNQLWMAHFALSDLDGGRHLQAERLARGAVGLAGAEADPLRVWLEDWELVGADGPGPFPIRLRAREGGAGDASPSGAAFALDLLVDEGKGRIAQGEDGLSRKGAEPGNASHYFSWTRMPARGTIELDGRRLDVEGLAWMDREWSTSALGEEHVGWDWFALQLDDGSELVLFELRRRDGRPDPFGHGALVEPDGTARTLARDAFQLQVLDRWRSPLDGTEYPAGWRVRVFDEEIELTVVPIVANQEMNLSVRYWEGAVAAEGSRAGAPVSGTGYAELTGYAGGPDARGVRSLQP